MLSGQVTAWRKVPEPILEVLGQRIKARRKRLGRTQSWLADAIEMDVSNLRGIENGRTEPSLRTIIKIAKALEMSFDALLVDLDHGIAVISLGDD
jgi:transcriptional regulator with XRE-family HTH domain